MCSIHEGEKPWVQLTLPFLRPKTVCALKRSFVHPHIKIPTSLASKTANLPAFRDSIELQKQKFIDKGLDDQDLIALVGEHITSGHTIGTSACQFFSDKLYNFNTTTGNGVDPSIDPTFLPQLQALCPQNGDANRRVALDTGSPNTFDASFFKNLKMGKEYCSQIRGCGKMPPPGATCNSSLASEACRR
ncbi:Peroxidase N1 [Vitis vinifera]|uniref:peroxidase n=1 Tax=Vitis vinifera TaxID=29760 RepID=A0A438CLX7_VITVI|nr:Peroxidase N1 [Vitis vinifera]